MHVCVPLFFFGSEFWTLHGKTMRDQKYEALQGCMQKLTVCDIICEDCCLTRARSASPEARRSNPLSLRKAS